MHTMLIIKRRKCRSSNQACKGDSEDIPRVEYRDACSNLFPSIEERKYVQSAWVEGSFYDTEEERDGNKTDVVLGECGECGDDRPGHHAGGHVQRGPYFARGHEHIRRDLGEEIPNI